MWNRKELKKTARQSLKRNYWRMVATCVLVAVFAGTSGLALSGGNINVSQLSSVNFRTASNTEIVNTILHQLVESNNPFWDFAANTSTATQGIFANVFNNITRSGSVIFGILNAVNQIAFGDRILAGVVILLGAILTFLYWIFVGNILRVGECRFFMENLAYPASSPERVLFLFRIKRVKTPAAIMLLRTLYNGLWFLTIVGGFIKLYSYRMIPYILAENPEVTRREAFALSKRMMRGNKWRTFLLDASFLGWYVLSTLTYGLAGLVLLYPYKNAANARLYIALRQKVLEEAPGAVCLLDDEYLTGNQGSGVVQYPSQLYSIPEHPSFAWLTVNSGKKYTLRSLVLMFFTFSMCGYLWEVFVDLVNTGHLVNRGTMLGPWLPIYGVGGVMVIVLLRRFTDKPVLTFSLVVVLCGVVEYATSWALEHFFGAKWWDYSGYFLNLDGRICAEGLLVFGIGGTLGIYLLAPSLDNLFQKIPPKTSTAVCLVLVVLFLADLAYSSQHPNMEASSANPDSTTARESSVPGATAGLPAGESTPLGHSALTSKRPIYQ